MIPRRFLVGGVAAAFLFGVGVWIGLVVETKPADIITTAATSTRVTTTVRTKTVKSKPRIIRRVVTVTRTRTVERPPTSSFIDYGEWDGVFRAYGVEGYIQEFGGFEVVGQIEYLGGLVDCNRVSYLQIDATFFQGGRIVGTAFTNMTSVPEGSRVPFSINHLEGSGERFRYELLLTRVTCDT